MVFCQSASQPSGAAPWDVLGSRPGASWHERMALADIHACHASRALHFALEAPPSRRPMRPPSGRGHSRRFEPRDWRAGSSMSSTTGPFQRACSMHLSAPQALCVPSMHSCQPRVMSRDSGIDHLLRAGATPSSRHRICNVALSTTASRRRRRAGRWRDDDDEQGTRAATRRRGDSDDDDDDDDGVGTSTAMTAKTTITLRRRWRQQREDDGNTATAMRPW